MAAPVSKPTSANYAELVEALDTLKAQHDAEVADLRQQLQDARQGVRRIDRAEVARLREQVDRQRVWLDRFIAGQVMVVDAGGTVGSFTTISDAVAASSPGDAIIVRPGRYAESLLLEKPRMTIRAAGAVQLVSTSGPAVRIGAPGCAIEGVAVECTSVVSSAVVVAAADCTLSDVVIEKAAMHGVQVTRDGGVRLLKCRVTNTKLNAVDVRGGNVELADTTITAAQRSGMEVYDGGCAAASNCMMSANGVNGAYVHDRGTLSAGDCDFLDNAFSNIDVVAGELSLTRSVSARSKKCGICLADGASAMLRDVTVVECQLPNIAVLSGASVSLERCTIEQGFSHGVVIKAGGDCHMDEGTIVRDNADTAVAREQDDVVPEARDDVGADEKENEAEASV